MQRRDMCDRGKPPLGAQPDDTDAITGIKKPRLVSALPFVHEIVDRAVLSTADCPQQKGRRRPSLSVRFGPEGDASRGTGIACTGRRVSPRLSEIAVTRTATGTTTAPAFAKGLYRGGGGWHGGGGGCALIVTGCATEEALTS